MNRWEHQPKTGPVEYTPLSAEQLAATCGNAVALVLAYATDTTPLRVAYEDPEAAPVVCGSAENATPRPLQVYEGTTLIERSITLAKTLHVQHVFALVGGDAPTHAAIAQAAQEAGATPLAFDAAAARADTLANRTGFQLFDQPCGVFEAAESCLAEYPDANAVLVLPCDVPRLTPEHVARLFSELTANPNADCVASWVEWLRRPPYLLPRTLFERVQNTGLAAPREGASSRPLPALQVKDVLFGEEHLAANAAGDAVVSRFLQGATLSARAAVRKASARDSSAPDEPLSQAKGTPSNSPDDALVAAAAQVLAANPADAELAWADAWAQRNRRDFPLLNDRAHINDLAFLDSSATAQRPACVLQAMEDFDKHENANVYRGAYDLSMQATFTLNDARAKMEAAIGAGRRQTIYTKNTTDAINLVALAWGEHNIGAGDVIVTTIAEHHSNYLPWMLLARRTGARLEVVGLNSDGTIDQAAFDAALALKPKLVAFAQMSNVLGLENPVKSMVERAHTAGARVLIDAAQGLPHLGVNVEELGADWVAFSGHKIYGPLGVGGLWVAPSAFDEMDPLSSGGGAISYVSENSYYLRLGAIQYELGTPQISQAVGLAAAFDYVGALGYEQIIRHDRALTRYLVAGLHAIDGITIWGDHDSERGWCGLVSFSVEGELPAATAVFLGKLGVCIRAGGHCALPLHARMGTTGTCRISIGVYTTKEDIDAALTALRVLTGLRE